MAGYTPRAVVVHPGDRSTQHLTGSSVEHEPGDSWPGRTSCGLLGDLEYVPPDQVSAEAMCGPCLAREGSKPFGQGADPA